METTDRQVRDFRRRVAVISATAIGVRYLSLWCLLWGTAVLALRAGFEVPREPLLWGLAGVLPAASAAAILGFRRRPARRAVTSLLDLHSSGGGLMMAQGEVEIGAWRGAVAEAHVPRLRGRRPWGLLVAGVAFVAAAFVMPVAPAGLGVERRLEIGEEIAALAERVDVLEQEGLLEEELVERFESELEALDERAAGDDPAAAWETLDHLQEMTDRAASEVAEAALTEGEQLAAAAAVAEVLSEGGDGLSERLATEALAELSALAASAADDSQLLDAALATELATAAEGALDLGRLAEALGRGKGDLGEKLERLYAGGMIDLEALLAAERALEEGDLDRLANYLDRHGLEAAAAACKGGVPQDRPGRGGTNRGRADAAMAWKDPSSRDGAKWRRQVLDPASLEALHQSHLLGLTAADPGVALEASPAAAGGAIDPAAITGGGAAYTHTLLPRHRSAVERYFDRRLKEGNR